MIKLTDTMREKLVNTGVYLGARHYYKYDSQTCVIAKYDKRGEKLIEVGSEDLNLWALVTSTIRGYRNEKT